jgi:hypothetical protein
MHLFHTAKRLWLITAVLVLTLVYLSIFLSGAWPPLLTLLMAFILFYVLLCSMEKKYLGLANRVITSSEFWSGRDNKWRKAAIEKYQWSGLIRGYLREYIKESPLVKKPTKEIGRLFNVRIEDDDSSVHRLTFLEVRCGTGRTIILLVDLWAVRELQESSKKLVPLAVAAQAWVKGETPDSWEPPVIRT